MRDAVREARMGWGVEEAGVNHAAYTSALWELPEAGGLLRKGSYRIEVPIGTSEHNSDIAVS